MILRNMRTRIYYAGNILGITRQYFLPVLPNILPLGIVHRGNPEFPLSPEQEKC
jgi:hypothetical protein